MGGGGWGVLWEFFHGYRVVVGGLVALCWSFLVLTFTSGVNVCFVLSAVCFLFLL